MMKIIEHISPDLIYPDLHGQTKAEVVDELARHLARTQFDFDARALSEALLAREALASTAVGEGVALPHCKFAAATRLLICIGRSTQGVDFESPDERPTHLFFVLVAPETMSSVHIKALGRISRLCKDANFRARLLAAATAAEVFQVIEAADADD